MRYEAIVFDFDGVLVESVDIKTQAFEILYSPFGSDVVSKVREHHLNNGGVSRKVKFAHYHKEFLGKSLTHSEIERLSDQFSEVVEKSVTNAPAVPGAMEFLEKYYKVLPLFVASGTPEDELKRIIRNRDMERFFQGTFGSPRKKGDILSGIVNHYDFTRTKVLMVGDAITDYEGAQEAQVQFVGRINKNQFPVNTQTINDLSELESLTL